MSVPAGRKGEKGQTLEQVEEMEGGTIKESKIGMAAAKRVDRRKQKASRDGEKRMNNGNQQLDAAAIQKQGTKQRMQSTCMTLDMGGEFGKTPTCSPCSHSLSCHAKPIVQKHFISHQIVCVPGCLMKSESYPTFGGDDVVAPAPRIACTHPDTGSLVPRRD